jgi:hypothetical protein
MAGFYYWGYCATFDGLAAGYLGWLWVTRLRSIPGRVFVALVALFSTACTLRPFVVLPASLHEVEPSVRSIYISVTRELARWGCKSFKMPVINSKECEALEERCHDMLRMWGVRLALANMAEACSRPRLPAPDALLIMEDMAFLARDTRVVSEKTVKEGGGCVRVRTEEGVLPEAFTREVVERFLNMDVEAEGGAPLEPLLLTGMADVIDEATDMAHRWGRPTLWNAQGLPFARPSKC